MSKQQFFVIIFIVIMLTGVLSGGTPPDRAQIPYKGQPLVKQEVGTIVRVVDGDTIIIEINGKQERVRLIGVNTPESVDPRKEVECFGLEAARFARGLLTTGTTIHLSPDPSQADRDKYGRLLRYVYQGDTLVNKKIIEEGYGYEYTYRTPYKYQKEFGVAEHVAQEAKKGLWADSACTSAK